MLVAQTTVALKNNNMDPADAPTLTGRAQRWPTWLPWAAIYISCGLVTVLRGNQCARRPTLCMPPYFLEAWLLPPPAHGFYVRGLLGTITHLLARTGPDVVVLNLIALAFSIFIVAALIIWLYTKATTLWARLAIAVLVSTPLCAAFFAQLGDPLAVVFAIFLVTVFYLQGSARRSGQVILATAFCLVAVAIHEASIFLFLPALVLIIAVPRRPALAAYFKYVLIATPFLLLAVLPNTVRPPDPHYQAFNSLSGEVIQHLAKPFPSYREMFPEVWAYYVSTPRRAIIFALKFARLWPFQLLAMVLVSGLIARRESMQALWRNWLYLFICSIPLYLVAVDWGRFSTITFWVGIIATWVRERKVLPAEPAPLPRLLQIVVPERMPPEGVLFGVLAALMLGANAIYPGFQVNGIPYASLPLLLPILIGWVMWRNWSRP
jgi:hypothetical protein